MSDDKGKVQSTMNSRSRQHSTKREEQRFSKKGAGKPTKRGAKQNRIHAADQGSGFDVGNLSILPHLFELWDNDNSGTICKMEVYEGLKSFCEKNTRIKLDWDRCRWLFSDVDTDKSGDLDFREFSLFLSKVGHDIGFSEESFAHFMVERLSNRKLGRKKSVMTTIPTPVPAKLMRKVNVKPKKDCSHSQLDETKMNNLGLADVIVQLWNGLQEEICIHESLDGLFIKKEVGSRGA